MGFNHNHNFRDHSELIGEDIFIKGFNGMKYLGVVEEIDFSVSGHGDSPAYAVVRLYDEETGDFVSERRVNCSRLV